MDEKTPIEKLGEVLDELVETYPQASKIQRNLIDSLFTITTEQLTPERLPNFAKDRIAPIKSTIWTVDATDKAITNKLIRIINEIIAYFNEFVGNSSQVSVPKSSQKKQSSASNLAIQRVTKLKEIFGNAKAQIAVQKEKIKEQKQQNLLDLEEDLATTLTLGNVMIHYIMTSFSETSNYMTRSQRKPWSCIDFKIDDSRIKARDNLIATANVLWHQLNEASISRDTENVKEIMQNVKKIMSYLASNEQVHHENVSGMTFFRNFTICGFKQAIDAMLAKIDKAEKDPDFLRQEYNDNNLWENKEPAYSCRCGGNCSYQDLLGSMEQKNASSESSEYTSLVFDTW